MLLGNSVAAAVC